MTPMLRCLVALVITLAGVFLPAAEPPDNLAARLRKLDGRVVVLGTVREPPLTGMLGRDLRADLRAANQREINAWEEVKSKADWERYRDLRLEALRKSLGQFPPAPRDLKARVLRTQEGDGYKVENLVFESRPGLVVTANLYRPVRPSPSMAGLVIVHSHHQAKNTGWRQDMGMTWARGGCLVLVPDLPGHGERRQHPFRADRDFAQAFPLARQDYHFRYDAGIQLDLIGDSLMGWLAWDVSRGVDLLLAQPGIDAKRIVLVSEPAGGGDVAAVAAALDPRIAGVVVNNFGGPQPETPYPLPKDAELSFEYAGGGSWESTRNLKFSARDGFLPWVIVAAVAPRRLVYYHEFYWDRERDPVWKRLQKVYGFYGSPDSVAGIAGHGFVVGSEPENTHWIPLSRELLYPTLERWFGIPNPKQEYSKRLPPEDLLCLSPELVKELKPPPPFQLAGQLGAERTSAARERLARLNPMERVIRLRQDWARLLGEVTPKADPVIVRTVKDADALAGVTVERIQLATEPGIIVPVLLLTPAQAKGRAPVVVGIAQGGKQEFLRRRSEQVAELLSQGVAVCLPDLRGIGETSPGEARDRGSPATALSATALMVGQPLLGARLRDLQAVIRHLRTRLELDGQRIALWGDSFASANPPERDIRVPHGIADRPAQSEPLGGLLALLAALFDDGLRAIYVHGGLSGYHAALQSPFCYFPHDVVVPGVLTAGDLCDLAAALAPRSLRMEGLVDGHNRVVPAVVVTKTYEPARSAYRTAKAEDQLTLELKTDQPGKWLATQIKAP